MIAQKIHISAPGKIILLGEHAVVYARPAIIASVAKRCYVTINERTDKTIEIISENLKTTANFTNAEIINKSKKASSDWQKFNKINDFKLLSSITEKPLDYAAIIIGETLRHLNKEIPSGFTLYINSEIPIGSGMGSSAALAVSICGAVIRFIGERFDKEKINEIAYLAEQKRHGFLSGADNSASCFGGLILFRKESEDHKIIEPIPFSIPKNIASKFIAIFTGTPEESTGELVSLVRKLYKKNQQSIDQVFNSQEQLTNELLTALKNAKENNIIQIIKKGEKNLEHLEVVSSQTKSLINEIEKKGGAAKICGAGGIKRGSGIILAYHQDLKILQSFLEKHKYDFSTITLGAEGVRIEAP
jgi:mevalonate kinase